MLTYPRNLKAVTKTNRKNKRPLFSLSNLIYIFAFGTVTSVGGFLNR